MTNNKRCLGGEFQDRRTGPSDLVCWFWVLFVDRVERLWSQGGGETTCQAPRLFLQQRALFQIWPGVYPSVRVCVCVCVCLQLV